MPGRGLRACARSSHTIPRAWRAPEGVSRRRPRSSAPWPQQWACGRRGLVGCTSPRQRDLCRPGPLTSCRARRHRPQSGRAVADS